MNWYIKWVGIPLTILTWFGIALLLLALFWPIGVVALIAAALLTEQLLIRYARSHQPTIRRGL